jgi:hypothetical protein
VTEWKLVPVEIAGGHVTRAARLLGRWHGSLLECHRAILAAAPEPPADERDAEIARLKALVESAYREGWHDGHWSELAEVDDLWPDSATRKALRGDANE